MWGCERGAAIFMWGIASKLPGFDRDVGRTYCRAVEYHSKSFPLLTCYY